MQYIHVLCFYILYPTNNVYLYIIFLHILLLVLKEILYNFTIYKNIYTKIYCNVVRKKIMSR